MKPLPPWASTTGLVTVAALSGLIVSLGLIRILHLIVQFNQ